MKIDWEKFQTAYNNASPDVQLLIDSEKIASRVDIVINKYNLTVPRASLVACAVNLILGMENETAVIVFLKSHQINDGQAQIMVGEISRYEGIDSSQKNSSEIASEIKEAESALSRISNLRTMATDGAQVGYQSTEEPVYTSVQSALLNESK
jgi:hypothetical protein